MSTYSRLKLKLLEIVLFQVLFQKVEIYNFYANPHFNKQSVIVENSRPMIIGHKKLKDDSKNLNFQNHEQLKPHEIVSMSEKRIMSKKFKTYHASQFSFQDEEAGMIVKYFYIIELYKEIKSDFKAVKIGRKFQIIHGKNF